MWNIYYIMDIYVGQRMSLFNGICVKILYRELKALEMALILSCAFWGGVEPSIGKGFDDQASRKIRRYDDKPISDVRMPGSIDVWHLLLPLWGKVGMGICLEDKKIGRYDNRKVSYLPLINLVPSPSWGRRNALYLHTSGITPNPLPQGTREKTLAAQLPSCSAADPTTTRPRTSPSSSAPLSSSSAEGWRSSLLIKTSWIPELRSRTTNAIYSNLTSPQALRRGNKYHTSLPLYIQTSRPLYIYTSIHPAFGHLLPQGAKGKSLTSIPPYIHTSIHPEQLPHPNPPQVGEGTCALHPYLHTSGITTNLLPQEAKGKSLTSIPPYIHTSIHPEQLPHPNPPQVGEGTCALPPYIHTSGITTNLLPQEAKEKTLAAQLLSCLAAFNGGVHD